MKRLLSFFPESGRHPTFIGIAAGLTATLFMGIVHTLAKEAAQYHHQVEIVFFRHVFSAVGILAFTALILRNVKTLKPQRYKPHILRTLVGTATMFCLFYALKSLSLAEASALFLTGPFFLVLLSWPLLGEKVGPVRLAGVAAGLGGAWLIIQPDHISSLTDALWGLGSALFSGLTMATLRWIGRSERALVTAFWFAAFGTLFAGIFLPFFWSPPSAQSLAILAALGFTAAIVQYFLSLSYIQLPAVTAGSLTYTMLIWSIVLDLIIWGVLPDVTVIAGGLLITGANVAILMRESYLRKKAEKDEKAL